jgi:hypothetical protein
LALGQRLHIADQRTEALAAEQLLVHAPLARVAAVVQHLHRVRLRAAHVIDAAVGGDPVEPRPHANLTVIGDDRVEGRHEDLLQRVLAVLRGAQHPLAEAQ